MNMTLMAMMASGGRADGSLVQAIIQQRKSTFEKWEIFIRFVAALLVQGIFWLRGIPVVQQAGTTPGATPPPATLDMVFAQVQAGQQDTLTIGFIRDSVYRAIDLLLALIKPSDLETGLMSKLMAGGGCGGGRPTPNQLRQSGGTYSA